MKWLIYDNRITAAVVTLGFVILSLPLLLLVIVWMGLDRRRVRRKDRTTR